MRLRSVFSLKKWLSLFADSRFSYVLSDKAYIKLRCYVEGVKFNLCNPITFNEKLQWLKLYDRKSVYSTMVDKYAMKKYVTEKLGEGYVVPLLGVWERAEDIDFESLPNQFVLKCNHNSGLGMAICEDKASFNKEKAIKALKKGLKQNYYYHRREWPYKDVPRRIIAEQFLIDEGNGCLVDYKFFCFNGEPKIMYRSRDNAKNPTTDFFDMDYNRLDIRMRDPNSEELPPRPSKFEEMKKIAAILSKNIPHLRVDFYQIEEKIYVGELTFFHCGGFVKIHPEKWNRIFGDWIQLPQ